MTVSLYDQTGLVEPRDYRLLTLLSGAYDDAIECTLHVHNLANPPAYEAISYAWGSSNKTERVGVNGVDLPITESLEVALRHLRRESEDRRLWIDAICINQSSNSERSHEISRMGTIYQSAKRVLVWLGQSNEDSDRALLAMQEISEVPTASDHDDDPQLHLFSKLEKFHDLVAVASLLGRRWFRRRWVIQEVAFAAFVVFQVGYTQLDWQVLQNVLSFFHRHQRFLVSRLINSQHRNLGMSSVQHNPYRPVIRASNADMDAPAACRLLLILRTALTKDESNHVISRNFTIEKLLHETPEYMVSDAQDLIYALVPLASDMQDDAFWDPNYSSGETAAYANLVHHIIRTTSTLDIICRPWTLPTAGLPSWIPTLTWRTRPISYRRMISDIRMNPKPFVNGPSSKVYNASFGTQASADIVRHIDGTYMLKAKGIVIDKIQYVHQAISGSTPWDYFPVQGWISALATMCKRFKSSSSTRRTSLPSRRWTTPLATSSKGSEIINSDRTLRFEELINEVYQIMVGDLGPDETDVARTYGNFFRDLLQAAQDDIMNLFAGNITLTGPLISAHLDHPDFPKFIDRLQDSLTSRQLIVTEKEKIGLCSDRVQKDDLVCILFGCSAPLILRKCGNGLHRLIGDSCIYGIMHGEIEPDFISGKFSVHQFMVC
jgi:hypothetical protein